MKQCPIFPPERVRIVEAGGNGWLVQIWPWSRDAGNWESITWESTREGAENSRAVLTGKRRDFHSLGNGE
jgi:hypothetical protein